MFLFLIAVNQVLLFLLIVTLCGILYKKIHKGTVLKNESGMPIPESGTNEVSQSQKDKESVIALM